VAEGVALGFGELLPINVADPTQPCSTFGVHPSLQVMQQLYQEGDAAFISNVGTLVEPMTKLEYNAKSKQRPPSLFAHNVQVKVTQSLHPQDDVAKGVLGRIVDVIGRPAPSGSPGYRANAYSLDGIVKILEGERPPNVMDKRGVVAFAHQDELVDAIGNLSLRGRSFKSVFGETWAQQLTGSLASSQVLGAALDGVTLSTTFPSDTLGQQFEQAARVVAARDYLEEERQVFYISLGGFDTHSSLKETVMTKFGQINEALTAFQAEMKAQGVWDSTVLVSSSDFGRTYATNGAGTDHAWGGNYFAVGGAVNGSQLFGSFPHSFVDESDLIISRGGRILPTTPWESVWHGLAEWFGVEPSLMAEVLPNFPNFPIESMLRSSSVDGRPSFTL